MSRSWLLGAMLLATGAAAQPVISGPVAAPDIAGAPTHDYPFFASDHPLALYGYREEEFYLAGDAATPEGPALPFKTRLVVRRPVDAGRFNGVVLVEWLNVSNGFDAENIWFFDWQHLLRDGYVWVGVSAQPRGVEALKQWNPRRYGDLAVAGPGGIADNSLAFGIFSAAGQALRRPGRVNPLAGLQPKLFLATGQSQSAVRLTDYLNRELAPAGLWDGYLLKPSLLLKVTPPVPVFAVVAEQETLARVRQPDHRTYREWQVAGTAHVDQHLRASREPLELRDLGTSSEASMALGCTVPTIGTRVPGHYVLAAALDHLARWATGGAPPPAAPPIEYRTGENGREIVRDGNGLARGGIRLAEVAAPTGLNVGTNGGSGNCALWGYYRPFDTGKLRTLYADQTAYRQAVAKATGENVRDGFLLPADAKGTLAKQPPVLGTEGSN